MHKTFILSLTTPLHFGKLTMLFKAQYLERYSRGRRGGPAKALVRATGARVQIPLSPPHKKIELNLYLFYLFKFKFFTMAQSVAHRLGKTRKALLLPQLQLNIYSILELC